ncbi:Hypothetical protein PHPALM_12790 [Phytophthora palmivora]|uniref:Uncharacterized protein n=1 Tax=Phytophthora palmivora TaxID=4796 RepID=A0A2P4XYW0_9STRA|nr:Hypothetical protein PHPALM_12790 [Phytophthora palmivora]
MNGYSRFVKIHLLKSKVSGVVNNHIQEYTIWAERQAGRMVKKMYTKKHSVKQVFADKGGGIINDAMEARCNSQGIEQIQVI